MAFDVAIVGGGPAGLFTALQAARQAPGWRVAWVRGRARGFPPAYATRSARHLLNVPAERMGAFPDAPHEFLAWLRRERPQLDARPGDFAPRGDYGAYLEDLAARLPQACASIDAMGIDAEPLPNGGYHVSLDDGSTIEAARLVVACGLPPPHRAWARAGVEADAWAWWLALPDDWTPPPADAEVLLVGSGLTAVDMAMGLRERGFQGRIRVTSPSGAWPEPHADAAPLSSDEAKDLARALRDASCGREMLAAVRAAARERPWRAVIEAVRPVADAAFAQLPARDQSRLLRHVFGLWNRHRHRMAPQIRAALEADAGIALQRGRVRIMPDGAVTIVQGGVVETASPALTLICAGPGYSDIATGDGFVARLVRAGLLAAHPLGCGVRAPNRGDLAVVGAALFGERVETTAVIALRAQAEAAIAAWTQPWAGSGI